MKKELFRGRSPYQILALFTVTLLLIATSFINYLAQSRNFFENEMYAQAQAAATNAANLLQHEVAALSRITNTAALLSNHDDNISEQEIIKKLQMLADKGVLVRTLFITLDGHAYTNYAGYLGQSDDNLQIDDMPIKNIATTYVIPPFYAEDVQGVVFGVAVPMCLGQHKGILISSYNVNDFQDILKSDFLQGSIQSGIIAQDGKIIFGRGESEFGMNIFAAMKDDSVHFITGSVENMQQDFAAGNSGIVSYKAGGEERYLAYTPTEISDWYVTTMIPEATLRTQIAPIQQNGSLLAILLVCIMVAFLLAVMIIRRKEEKKIRKILRDAAMYDGLTRIYNRATTEQTLTALVSASMGATQHCMFIIDIDNFKNINDVYGHIVGDETLVAFAKRLQQLFNQGAIVGRLGGDEFLVFLQNYVDRTEIIKKAELIIQPIQIEKEQQVPPVSVSLGISLYPTDGSSFMELYQCADKALYRAKHEGKDGFIFYDECDSPKDDC